MGQRVSQLTYNDNLIGGGSTDPKNIGLTEYGAAIVERMNHLGMAVDVIALLGSDHAGCD